MIFFSAPFDAHLLKMYGEAMNKKVMGWKEHYEYFDFMETLMMRLNSINRSRVLKFIQGFSLEWEYFFHGLDIKRQDVSDYIVTTIIRFIRIRHAINRWKTRYRGRSIQ